LSLSTVFSSDSPVSSEKEPQESSTLAAFVAHIERLQDQVRQKDVEISELLNAQEQLLQKQGELEREQEAMALQMDIQNNLLRKTRRMDAHVEQLRTAVIDREAIIGEKQKSISAIERQLEHHKLLLQAQIRRQATMTIHAGADRDPLPELTTLATKADIDRWIHKLQERLEEERPTLQGKDAVTHYTADTQVANLRLRQEIDFYIREIIYYKLDIRGYKTDIKKLKKITSQLSTYGSRASDLESDTSSLRPATTPSQPQSTAVTPEIGGPSVSSTPVATPTSKAASRNRPLTPPPSGLTTFARTITPANKTGPVTRRVPSQPDFHVPTTPQTPAEKVDPKSIDEPGHIEPATAPHSAVRTFPERKKLTVRKDSCA
jgi:hypothetical protein